jgi:hypothetical protein
MIMHKVDERFDETVIVGSWSRSGKVKLSIVTLVNLRILGMSSIPPLLKAAVMLLSSRMTSVTWTKAALEAALMVGEGAGIEVDMIEILDKEN